MEITLVAALDRNRVIGRRGAIPWHLPDDLAHFKRETLGKPILMGRTTYETVGRPLPRRLNIVLSRTRAAIEGCVVATGIDEALAAAGDVPEACVIGGGVVYEAFLPRATRMVLTHVDAATEGDARFPEFSAADWRVVSREPHAVDARHAYAFEIVRYQRT